MSEVNVLIFTSDLLIRLWALPVTLDNGFLNIKLILRTKDNNRQNIKSDCYSCANVYSGEIASNTPSHMAA